MLPPWAWSIFSAACLLSWGFQYTLTPKLKAVSPFVIMIVIGSIMLIIGTVGHAAKVLTTSAAWWADFESMVPVFGTVLLYADLLVLGHICLLYATTLAPDNEGLIVSVTSLYPMITMLVLIVTVREDRHLNIRFLAPAMILAPIALVLFGLAKFLHSEPVLPAP
jgi:hypothetical protein